MRPIFFDRGLTTPVMVFVFASSALTSSLFAQTNTDGFCSPIIEGVAKGANVTIRCNLTREEASATSSLSFEEAYWALSRLVGQQTNYLLPLLDAFSEQPSRAKWNAIQREVTEISELVKHAREALFVFEATLPIEKRNEFQNLHGLLSKRGIALLYIFENESAELEVSTLPDSLDQLDDWIVSYGSLVQDLEEEMWQVVGAIERMKSDLS